MIISLGIFMGAFLTASGFYINMWQFWVVLIPYATVIVLANSLEK